VRTYKQTLKAVHKEAKAFESLAMTKYIQASITKGRSHPETRRAMDRHLAASARVNAEKAKRLIILESKANGKRKAKIRAERIAAETAYEMVQKFRGL
jgi:hypothetical protein